MKRNLLLLAFIHFVCYLTAAPHARNNTNFNGTSAGITDGFITQWQTTSNDQQIVIPINTLYTTEYNYTVNWGDGSTPTTYTANATHTYATTGLYTVTITGDFPAIKLGDPSSDNVNDGLIKSVIQWGNGTWKSMDAAFKDCVNLTTVPNAVGPVFAPNTTLYCMFYNCASFNGDLNKWDLTNVRETSFMFYNAPVFNGNISTWNVENVTNMQSMFASASAFNGDLSSWDVGKVTLMDNMFNDAKSFNGNISGWNVQSVTDMSAMFANASVFNQNLDSWTVGNVKLMYSMFESALAFNGNISSWDVGSVTSMENMFRNASAFNQNLSTWNVGNVKVMDNMFMEALVFNSAINNWNVESVTGMRSMFKGADMFNQNIGAWDVSKVEDMSFMFAFAYAFNQNLNNWHVGNVTDMSGMFLNDTLFNGNISSWNVGAVTNMKSMFQDAIAFNKDIGNWQVSAVTDMSLMFRNAASFNQNISAWNTSNVTKMVSVFEYATAFNQNLGQWQLTQVADMEKMLSNSGLSASNYESTLAGWAEQVLQANMEVGVDGLKFCDNSARQSLIQDDGWQFIMDQPVCFVPATPDGTGIVYVDSMVSVPGDGSSWNKALQYLSNATESARINDAIKQIHVAKGTYYPTGNMNVNYQDTSFVITKSDLRVLGGYPNGGGARNANLNTTLLSGDIGVNNDLNDNSRGIMLIQNIDATDSLIVDGFTLTKGAQFSGSDNGISAIAGGLAIFNSYANTVINNCKFIENYGYTCAAIGIFGDMLSGMPQQESTSRPQILNCLFKNNEIQLDPGSISSSYGGIFVNAVSSPYVNNCQFIGNKGFLGSATTNGFLSNPVFHNCTFSDNSGLAPVSLNLLLSMPTYVNCLIKNNLPIYHSESGMDSLEAARLNNAIVLNIQGSGSRLINCTVVNNKNAVSTSTDNPLILNVLQSASYITNSVIWGNSGNKIFDSLPGGGVASSIGYSLIQGMGADGTTHNLDGTVSNSIFIDSATGDFHLVSGTTLIDAGLNDSLINVLQPYLGNTSDGGLDLSGHQRILENTIDLGAFEFTGAGLPVKMSDLHGKLDAAGRVVLSWTTYQETGNKGFKIQVSSNGVQFTNLGFVESLAAEGTSTASFNYNYSTEVLVGTKYYRVVQQDHHGIMTASNVIRLQSGNLAFKVSAFPNPVHNKLHIKIDGQRSANAKLVLVDFSGRVIQQIKVNGPDNYLNMQGLTSGIYVVRYVDDKNKVTIKIVKD